MGSSAQNSSGVHWCRRRVRFNEVPEKVPKVLEKVWEALVQSQVRFNRVPEKVPEKVWEALVKSQVRFNRVPKKVPEKVPGGFGAEPSQVQQGSGESLGGFGAEPGQPGQVQQGSAEVSGEGLRGFGAEPGQVQQGSKKGSRRLCCRARSGSTGFRRRFRTRCGRLWCRAKSGSTGFRRKSGRLWCRARSGSTGFRRRLREAARFRKICIFFQNLVAVGNTTEVFFNIGFDLITGKFQKPISGNVVSS